jgi:uncharacterized membrane protein
VWGVILSGVKLPRHTPLGFAWLMLVSGAISLVSSWALAREGYLLASEGRKPSCDINPFFSCGSVMESWQARIFLDAPNQLTGIAGFAVVVAIAVALLQGAKFPRWFWAAFTMGLFVAWFFLMWLFVQAVFVIGYLCLYCMVVWVTHTVLWWVYLPWAAQHGLLGGGNWLKRAGAALLPYSWVAIVLNFAFIGLSIWAQFPLLFAL